MRNTPILDEHIFQGRVSVGGGKAPDLGAGHFVEVDIDGLLFAVHAAHGVAALQLCLCQRRGHSLRSIALKLAVGLAAVIRQPVYVLASAAVAADSLAGQVARDFAQVVADADAAGVAAGDTARVVGGGDRTQIVAAQQGAGIISDNAAVALTAALL